jgi:polyphosphate kinase
MDDQAVATTSTRDVDVDEVHPPPSDPPRVAGAPPGTLPRTRAVLHDHPPTEGERRILNRELTWLSFNERVLALAERTDVPLLERAKFLAIFASNLDEFFQVRVAGLMEQVAAGRTAPPPDGMTPSQQLTAIRHYARELCLRQAAIFADDVSPALAREGIVFRDWASLDAADRDWLTTVFDERVFPVLTPLAVDPAHPFPYISNLSLNLAVVVRDPHDGDTRFARVKVPPILSRFVVLPDGERVVPLEQVMAVHLDRLFPGLEVVDHHVFRVTRNADYELEEDEVEDLMLAIESELHRRRFGRVVRLEVEPDIPPEILSLLLREMDLDEEQVDRIPGPPDLTGLFGLYEMVRPDLKFPKFKPTVPAALSHEDGGTIFAAMADHDIMVHHPYDSFSRTVQEFVDQAAKDPHVLAIKITLYRTSGPGSPLVRSLIKAAEAGKQVVALVELKARFDEEANIEWARVLEEAGVHVAYGVVGLKTHTKIALVVRREGPRMVRYSHVGTGNYNDRTARLYEDIGLLTSDPAVGADLTELFNVMTGYGTQRDYRRLITAPDEFRPAILERIAAEAAAPDGRIRMKMNSLIDEEMIEALYAASAAGTPIDLVVRGICGLRAGVPGLSETVRVRSVIGRYLEHSRIFAFGPDERVDVIIGSGDLMPRNLDRRVEAFIPITDPDNRRQLLDLLDLLMRDDVLAWAQEPDGAWSRVPMVVGVDTHVRLQELAHERARGDITPA